MTDSYIPPAGRAHKRPLNECEKRANRMALNLYGYTGEAYDDRSNIVDALTDLRHMSDAANADFFAALDVSYQRYLAEKSDDPVAFTDDDRKAVLEALAIETRLKQEGKPS